MVKIEEAPHKKIERGIQDNICNIQSCLHPPDLSFSLSSSDCFGNFEGKITETVKKTKTHFYRKREVQFTKEIATVHFKRESNSIYLSGNLTDVEVDMRATIYTTPDNKRYTVRSDIKAIAERLEAYGYNVTIWI